MQIHLQERISSSIAKAVVENAADLGILNAGNYGDIRVTALTTIELANILHSKEALRYEFARFLLNPAFQLV